MEYEHETEEIQDGSDATAVKLSLTGGFVGTVTGLKKSGLPGAVVGGLVGGTAGYLAGAVTEAPEPVDPLGEGSDESPITVDVSETGDDSNGDSEADAGDDEGDEAGADDGDDEGDGTGHGDEADADDGDDEDGDDQ